MPRTSSRTSRRLGAALVPLLLGVLALTGCSSSSDSAGTAASPSASATADRLTPVAAVRAAAEATAKAGSSRFELTSTTTAGGQTVDFTGSGVFDPGARTGTMTFTLPGGAGTLEERFIGDDLYMTVPGQEGFFKLSLKDLVGTSLASSVDPTASFQTLQGVSDDVQEAGKEDVRGTSTTHYKGTLDLQKALERVDGVAKELVQQAVDATGGAKPPFDAWIDGDGVLRKFVQTLDLPASDATGGQPVTSTTTMELFDFGVPVDVTPPPDDQVKDGAPLLDALRGSTG